MIKLKFAAAAAVLAAGFAVSHEADARCWWNGYGRVCSGPSYYDYGSASQFNNPATYGYVPRGLPHPNGPQPGGGGCYMGQSFSAGCGDR